MVRIAIQLVKGEEYIQRIPLAGLCSTMRAGLAVLETRGYVDEDVIEAGELEAYVKVLKWFSARWTIGTEYLARVEKVLGHL